jgi:hypothetical protein
MSGPETRFYTAVHKLLPRTIYREKMANPYSGGTADVWYSGNFDDLWAEYKWIPTLPKQAPVCLDKLLSSLQQRWLAGRHEEGRNVVVILGTPEGAWVFEGTSWTIPLPPDVIRTQGFSKQMIADYIKKRVSIDVLVNPHYPDNSSNLPVRTGDDDDD